MTKAPILFAETALDSPITEFALQITSSLEGNHYACGTAVLIAPQLALTAQHVFDDHWRKHEGEPLPINGDTAGRLGIALAQVVGAALNIWEVTKAWTTELSDIVLLSLAPKSRSASEYRFRRLFLDMAPPGVGEQVNGFGFTDSLITAESGALRLKQRGMTTQGTVVEVFHDKRDSIKMPFPCFRTNARFDGGMSGGPIFNQSGNLCGLICSSYPALTPEEDHASYAASLWPIMSIPIDHQCRDRPVGNWYSTLELIEGGTLLAENADLLVADPIDPSVGIPAVRRIGFDAAAYERKLAGTDRGQSGGITVPRAAEPIRIAE